MKIINYVFILSLFIILVSKLLCIYNIYNNNIYKYSLYNNNSKILYNNIIYIII